MGAPMGNKNAAGSHKGKSKGKKSTKGTPMRWVNGKKVGYKKYAAKGWYKKSGGRSVLKTIKRLTS